MTRYTRVRLAPRGPFHFGGRGVGMEHSDVGLPADSLFSALCITLAAHAGSQEVDRLLEQFRVGDAPFRLTSLMPYAAGVTLLPYPMIGPPQVTGAEDLKQRKLFKAIAWVSEAVFGALAQGETPSAALDNGEPITLHAGKVWVTATEHQALEAFEARDPETHASQKAVLWRTGRRPRVAVDRGSSASAVYSTGATEFNRATIEGAEGEKRQLTAGLYTVIEWLAADQDLRDRLRVTFEQMGADGIGGERSSGHGQFTPDWEDVPDWSPGAGSGPYFATLSPYHPRWDERAALAEGARYEIVLRRGWLSLPGYQNLRRSSVRMIADGSVLRWPETGGVLGDLADVTPKRLLDATGQHVYRYGLAFPVRIADAAMRPGGAA